jgi:hypothetical protein
MPQMLLNFLPELAFQDRFMLSWISLSLVTNLADVDRIGQQFVQRAARKAPPA